MESSSSQLDNPPERVSNRLAELIGALIALMTLTIPVVAIAYFSSSSLQVLPPPGYSAPMMTRP
ncbi:MAG: hypothetical protein KME20_02875 [Kaiparowitsia implicata GSE-PSE-MK54-09C]|jgi:hypothetical protein|nr:hypothetical protein [Kaiparowitsia implicata GSE-PSE-MK54-09C]